MTDHGSSSTVTGGPNLPETVRQFLATDERGMWINNAYVDTGGASEIASENPATGQILATVQAADAADVDVAVASAVRALKGPWSKLSTEDRGVLLNRAAEIIDDHSEELSVLETLECGKPIRFTSQYDIPTVARMFRYFAGWTNKNPGQVLPVAGDFHVYTRHEPVGVCAGILPWNSPLAMASWKLAPALACGNVMIIKPAEQTPLTMLRLAELLQDAGIPPGVVNVVPGYGEVAGAALAQHPGVDKVAFTGEYTTGREIVRASAVNLKRVSLELGGKSPNVVFADAPADAVEGSVWGVFYNAGQSCSAGSRLFIEAATYDDVLSSVAERAKDLKIGPGILAETEIGPLVSQDQTARVLSYIESAREDQATIVTGGGRVRESQLAAGYFVEPTVIADTTNDARVAREEIFGPVVTVLPFSTEEELVAKANDSMFGLAAGIWTSDVKRAHRVAAAVRAGTIWINCYGEADPAAPFGGFRMSGYGREMGSYALQLYTEVKCVWTKLT